MKKAVYVIVGFAVVAAVGMFAMMAFYTAPEGTFDNWNKSFDTAKADAIKRNVPILVKIGSKT